MHPVIIALLEFSYFYVASYQVQVSYFTLQQTMKVLLCYALLCYVLLCFVMLCYVITMN